MPLVDNTHYVDSVGWTAVTAWATGTAKAAGVFVRQLAAPTVNNERVFICIVAGTTHATTEPTWTITRGGKTTDNTVTWQECTGLSAVNGDMANTPTWAEMKAITSTGVLGQILLNNAETHVFIMSTAGTIGASQPTFNTTTGATTADNTATWTCIGAVGAFTGNQAPHARLFPCLAVNWMQGSNIAYVKSSHAETQTAALTLAAKQVVGTTERWLCHNGSAYPPLAANLTTGATITTTAGNLIVNGIAYVEGITFSATAGSSFTLGGSTTAGMRFKNCTFARDGGSNSIGIGNSSAGEVGNWEFDNCSCSFGQVTNIITMGGGNMLWKNSTFHTGAAIPTNTFSGSIASMHFDCELHGIDFSVAGSGKTIAGTMSSSSGRMRFVNCKFHASATLAVTPSDPWLRIEFVNCNSGAVNYTNTVYDYSGTLTTETTIVLTGGASDGVTPISWKVVTTANAGFIYPFICPPIAVWNDAVGSPKTLTIQGIWGGGAVPTNADVSVEVEYLSSTATPIASFISDGPSSILSTATSQDAGTGTWGGSTTKFALAVTFTPQMKGFIYARVKCGAASGTFYLDPRIVLT